MRCYSFVIFMNICISLFSLFFLISQTRLNVKKHKNICITNKNIYPYISTHIYKFHKISQHQHICSLLKIFAFVYFCFGHFALLPLFFGLYTNGYSFFMFFNAIFKFLTLCDKLFGKTLTKIKWYAEIFKQIKKKQQQERYMLMYICNPENVLKTCVRKKQILNWFEVAEIFIKIAPRSSGKSARFKRDEIIMEICA